MTPDAGIDRPTSVRRPRAETISNLGKNALRTLVALAALGTAAGMQQGTFDDMHHRLARHFPNAPEWLISHTDPEDFSIPESDD